MTSSARGRTRRRWPAGHRKEWRPLRLEHHPSCAFSSAQLQQLHLPELTRLRLRLDQRLLPILEELFGTIEQKVVAALPDKPKVVHPTCLVALSPLYSRT